MFFLYKEGCESPGRATVEFPIKGVCCNTGTFEAVIRAVVDSGSKVTSSDSVRAGRDIERCSDKDSALNHLQSQSKAVQRRPSQRESRETGWGMLVAQSMIHQGVLLVMFNFSGKC